MRKNRIFKKSGQIAVILIFFIAVLLAAFAVVINIGKISQNRTAATIAVDTAAATMASSFASYAESWFQSVIEPGEDKTGRLTRYEHGGALWYILEVLIALVLLVLAIVILVATEGTGAALTWAIVGVVISGLATLGAVTVFVVQVAYVNPQMNRMWNKMFKNLSIAEQFRQQGLQSLFSYSVQDPVLIDDTGDFDMDGYFKGDGTAEGDKEKVGRFAVLNTRRAEWLSGKAGLTGPMDTARTFAKVLAKLLYTQDEPHLHPAGYNGPSGPLSYYVFRWDPNWNINTPDPAGVTPFGLKDKDKGGAPPLGTYFYNESLSACDANVPFLLPGCMPNGTSWIRIFDPLWENPGTSNPYPQSIVPATSFRERLGRDDENAKIYFTPISSNPMAVSGGVAADHYFNPPEWREADSFGIYRLLWEMDKVDLGIVNQLEQPSEVGSQDHRGCFWCADGYSSCPASFPTGFTLPYPGQCTNTNNPYYYGFGGNPRDCWCLKTNVDKAKVTPIPLAENTCPDASNLGNFTWKKGITRYCSTEVPYGTCSVKNCDSGCSQPGEGCPIFCSPRTCGLDSNGQSLPAGTNEPLWREDLMDFLRYDPQGGIDAFITASQNVIEYLNNMAWGNHVLSQNFYYFHFINSGPLPGFYHWIKIKDGVVDVANYQPSDFAELGGLQKWIVALDTIKNEINAKRLASFQSQPGGVCSTSQTPSDLKMCLNNKITAIDTCLSSCSVQNCTAIAADLSLPFNTSYSGQTTNCNINPSPLTPYVFLRELSNWRVKLAHRRDYLFGPNGNDGLYAKMKAAVQMISDARQAVYDFLSNPAVNDMRNLFENPPFSIAGDKGEVVYAWRDEAKPGQPSDSGKWHIVRSKVGVPTLCNGQCGRTQCEYHDSRCNDSQESSGGYPYDSGCKEPHMPAVIKWSHDIGTHLYWSVVDYVKPGPNDPEKSNQWEEPRGCCGKKNKGDLGWVTEYQNKESFKDARKCFKGGLVRASLMRYDEGEGLLSWATGVNFWKTRFKNPNAPGTAGYSSDQIEQVCGPLMAGNPNEPAVAESPDGGCSYGVDGAFVLNCISSLNEQCWWIVKDLVRNYGTESQSCAEYFCRGHDERGYDNSKFGVKFVPCPKRNW